MCWSPLRCQQGSNDGSARWSGSGSVWRPRSRIRRRSGTESPGKQASACSGLRSWSPVRISPVAHGNYIDQAVSVVNSVDDAVFAYTESPQGLSATELSNTSGSRLIGQLLNSDQNSRCC